MPGRRPRLTPAAVCPRRPLPTRRARPGERGQSLVEFSLAFPIFMLVLGVAALCAQLFTSSVELNGAARAGAIVAARDVNTNLNVPYSQEVADATAAVNDEEGCIGCYVASTSSSSGGCPTNPAPAAGCVWITTTIGARSQARIDIVHIAHYVAPWVGAVSAIQIQVQAGATP